METTDSTTNVMWRRSARSGTNGNCVEVATRPGRVLVRDSKRPDSGTLAVPPDAWRSFLATLR